jgi:proline iminopeptidase
LLVPALTAQDGTKLAYHVFGEGTPVVCLAGGPMRDSAYLGDLGGLSRSVRLIMLDCRGTGQSHAPANPASYRCDYLVEDVAALREHLDLDRINLLGHSAGANLATQYAARRPEHIDKLLLITPGTSAVGIPVTSDLRREVVRLREGEAWFAAAAAAFERIQDGQATGGDWAAIAPFTYGRWDAAAQAHHQGADDQRNPEAAAGFGAEGAFDPHTTRTALAGFSPPVLVLAGELDVAAPPRVVAEFAGLFPNATLVTEPGAGHYPWLDDPTWFTTTITGFLGHGAGSDRPSA